MYDVVVEKFTFAISSPDEFLFFILQMTIDKTTASATTASASATTASATTASADNDIDETLQYFQM